MMAQRVSFMITAFSAASTRPTIALVNGGSQIECGPAGPRCRRTTPFAKKAASRLFLPAKPIPARMIEWEDEDGRLH